MYIHVPVHNTLSPFSTAHMNLCLGMITSDWQGAQPWRKMDSPSLSIHWLPESLHLEVAICERSSTLPFFSLLSPLLPSSLFTFFLQLVCYF